MRLETVGTAVGEDVGVGANVANVSGVGVGADVAVAGGVSVACGVSVGNGVMSCDVTASGIFRDVTGSADFFLLPAQFENVATPATQKRIFAKLIFIVQPSDFVFGRVS